MRRKQARLSLLGLLLLQAFTHAGISAQVVRGRLTDMEAGTPITFGRVTLLDTDGTPLRITVTDIQGYYLLAVPAPGEYWLKAESEFHQDLSDGPISLAAGDTVWLDYQVEARAVQLDSLVVETEGRSPRLKQVGFYDRMDAHVGRYFDEEQIRAYSGNPVSNIIKLLPMVELRPDTMFPVGHRVGVLFRRRQFQSLVGDDGPSTMSACYPQVFLNGLLMSIGGKYPAGLDHFLSNSLVGIEVYEDPAFLPPRFHGRYEYCGTIVLWAG